jgi:peroxiredoxin
VLVARFVVAGVFALAGVAKLADLAGSRQAVRDFGLPRSLAATVGTLLPLAELAVAGALIGRGSATWGAVAALVLLLAFVLGVGGALLRGEQFDCHCFGQLRSSPAGWSTLVRNVALALLAGVILLDGPGASATGWLDGVGSGELAALIGGLLVLCLIAVQAAFSYQLLRQNGRLITRVEALEGARGAPVSQAAGLPVGAPAPGFTLSGVDGRTVSLDSLRARGRAVMLVFSLPGCGACESLLGELGRWQQTHAQRLTIALISQGSPAQNSKATVRDLLLQADREVADAYHAFASPSAQLVSTAAAIASPLAQGADEIRTLLDQALDQAAPALRVTHTNGNGALPAPAAAEDAPPSTPEPPASTVRTPDPRVTGAGRRTLGTPARALLATGAGALATQVVASEASAASGAAALKQILEHAKPALVTDNDRISAALKQRVSDPKHVPTAAIKAIGTERALLTSLHGKIAAVHTTHPAKALALSAVSLSAQTLHELQRTLASAKLNDIKRHAADTRALSGKAQHAISRAEKALG